MESGRPVLFLHVGARKSGTSALQQALRESTGELSEQGVRFWLIHRKSHSKRLLAPIRAYVDGGDRAESLARLRLLADRMLEDDHPRHLLTIEDLAEQPPHAVELVQEAFADLDLHVVITARHWGRTLPSEWQQCLKERLATPLPEFVEEVRAGTPSARERFLDRQDVPAVAARWQGLLPADRVVVLPVADATADSTLGDDFCRLIGVDPGSLRFASVPANPSLGAAQAEVLRRVNESLGDRLPDHLRGGYWRVVRKQLVQASLRNQPPLGRILLPREHAAWVHETTAAWPSTLAAAGYTVLGDPQQLVAPEAVDESYAPPSDQDVADVAVRTLSDAAALWWEEMEARPNTAPATPPAGVLTRAWRRAARR